MEAQKESGSLKLLRTKVDNFEIEVESYALSVSKITLKRDIKLKIRELKHATKLDLQQKAKVK